ncbi:MAG: RpoD/SigA family RNA polymerase sigma factor [Xenococcaceae cyanobacterium MO_207.B15]|nr:RpoD/SigA family RNA polymerase sigma factor [Xenococcaceae cyanobacterium MO_207.B15]
MTEVKLENKNNSTKLSTDTVAVYLREIGKVPMLDPDEEIIFGKRVQRMMSLLAEKDKLEQSLERVVSNNEWASYVGLSEKELNQVLHSCKLAKNKMIRANLRLVVSIAKKYLNRNLEFLDLIQEGSIGLEKGVEKFDPSKGYKFSTYAYWWIRQGITRAVAQKGRTIRLPVNITEKLNKIKKIQQELALKLGRSATTNEIADELGVKPDQVTECLKIARVPMSLDMRVGESEDTELSSLIEDNSPSPSDFLDQDGMRQEVQKVLAELKPSEREIISLRFGLVDGTEWTLQAIGKKLGVSRERVRQVQNFALLKLKRKNLVTLRDYLK